MIQWPTDASLPTEGREGLNRFRQTSAAAGLEAEPRTWTVVAWPWTRETPLRVILEDEERHAIAFTMREADIWTMAKEPREVHERTPAEVAREAEARVLP